MSTGFRGGAGGSLGGTRAPEGTAGRAGSRLGEVVVVAEQPVGVAAEQPVGRVVVDWEDAYAAGYQVEVSANGSTWQTVAQTAAGDGGLDTVKFAPVTARHVRLHATRRATNYGYSVREFTVHGS